MTQASTSEYRANSQASPRVSFSGALLGAVIALYILATLFAFTQAPRTNPLTPVTLAEMLFSPWETNALVRLPRVTGGINDIVGRPGGKLVWAVGADGLIIHSQDGGENWVQQAYPGDTRTNKVSPPASEAGLFKQISLFQTAQAAVVDGKDPGQNQALDNVSQTVPQNLQQQIQQTTPPPQLVEAPPALPVAPGKPDLYSIAFSSDLIGLAVGEKGTILKTIDGGDSWQKIASPTSKSFMEVQFLTEDEAVIIDQQGYFLTSNTQGDQWQGRGAKKSPDGTQKTMFLSSQQAFASDSHKIVTTQDGGENWSTKKDFAPDNILAWDFLDAQNGIVFLSGNKIGRTRNGGESWDVTSTANSGFSTLTYLTGKKPPKDNDGSTSAATPVFSKLTYLDREILIGKARDGLWKSTNNGKDWRPVTLSLNINSVSFSGKLGIAVGEGGLILRSTDAGTSWNTVASGIPESLTSVDARNKDLMVIVSFRGKILHSSDAGKHWEIQDTLEGPELELFNKVQVFDNTIKTSGDHVSRDRGINWTRTRASQPGEIFFKSDFFDEQRGIAVDGNVDGSIYVKFTTTDGNTWTNAKVDGNRSGLSAKESLSDNAAFAWIDANTAIIADAAIIKTTDGGANWSAIAATPTNTYGYVKAVAFANNQRGLLVGDNGNISQTNDGGNSWKKTDPNLNSILKAVAFIDPDTAVVWGRGIALTSADGGTSWRPLSYSRVPAPWYWLATGLLACYALWFFIREPASPSSGRESIADLLASDRPLRPGDPDPLEFGTIARGLSRFMRNPSTEPPLTLAITGAWGTGKSSLMNLLHSDLKRFGFTPVWFNAWHHQKGEQLLASLYANIRNQAIPGWFAVSQLVPVGLIFRINLLFRRSAKHWLTTLLMISLFVAAATYIVDHNATLGQLKNIWNEIIKSEFNLEKLIIPLLGGPLALMFHSMRAFGLSPLNLITGTHANDARQVDPSARQQFAREFDDVAKSLSLGRMVIFIDDLDRCSKENVVDILEAINFLSVSGDCYIVLGMDEAWVKVCIAEQFPEMAKNNPQFAEQYLEKIINIKVPVPALSDNHSSQLLSPQLPREDEPSRFDKLCDSLKKYSTRYRYSLIMLCVIGAGIVLGKWPFATDKNAAPPAPKSVLETAISWQNININDIEIINGQPKITLGTATPAAEKPPAESASPQSMSTGWELSLQATPEALAEGIVLGKLGNDKAEWVLKKIQKNNFSGANTETDTQAPTAVAAEPAKRIVNELHNGQTDRDKYEILLPLLAGLLLLAGAILYSMKTPQRRPQDSNDFKAALTIWQSWILLSPQTPRGIKRYLNRVRYFAMRFRPEENPGATSFFAAIKQFFRPAAETDQESSTTRFEANLVALSAIDAVDKRWLLDDERFRYIKQKNIQELVNRDLTGSPDQLREMTTRLTSAITAHQKKFDNSFISDAERQKFLTLLADIKRS